MDNQGPYRVNDASTCSSHTTGNTDHSRERSYSSSKVVNVTTPHSSYSHPNTPCVSPQGGNNARQNTDACGNGEHSPAMSMVGQQVTWIVKLSTGHHGLVSDALHD